MQDSEMERKERTHKRILIVDDDAWVLFVMRQALIGLDNGYEIVIASNGFEALEKINQAPCDLVITDVKMPGMDGVALTKRIRALGSKAVVLWVTAQRCSNLADEIARLGVRRCVNKPLEIDEIRHLALEAMGEPEVSRSLENN